MSKEAAQLELDRVTLMTDCLPILSQLQRLDEANITIVSILKDIIALLCNFHAFLSNVVEMRS